MWNDDDGRLIAVAYEFSDDDGYNVKCDEPNILGYIPTIVRIIIILSSL